ncbi:REP-associated tyrosine transposase [Blastopirellula retiformator]|uniref:Transposase IS200 like protein n=1 Tax=Blastopirellula retiformator TaxID=2527970 RepID=A0A5C5VK67_9BACT|nr:transposase [Blastopirellula retiformator]TWT38461.1 Transposase IS200 like protein [Blastopirellula retiformator]
MPNFRRYFLPGGTFFFTLVTQRRRPIFSDRSATKLLGDCLRECQELWPFEVHAIVLLPDHLHTIWTVPKEDDDYSRCWSWTKRKFTQRWLAAGGREQRVSSARQKEGRRGVWQARFWEHTIKDEDDFERHFDYIHYNPVKHGLVKCLSDWLASSFHRWVTAGVYHRNWACGERGLALEFRDIPGLDRRVVASRSISAGTACPTLDGDEGRLTNRPQPASLRCASRG